MKELEFQEIITTKFHDLPRIAVFFDYGSGSLRFSGEDYLLIDLIGVLPSGFLDYFDSLQYGDALVKQAYVMDFSEEGNKLYFSSREGFINALSSLKQIIFQHLRDGRFMIPHFLMRDCPSLVIRSISTTFAWYAGYGRIGFDMQLWGLDEWRNFLLQCSDFKINQVNMCIYGYWPFEFPEYPDTSLQNLPIKVWNKESKNWINIYYTHPNIAQPFLSELIEFAHSLSIRIHAYIGLNSYNGGYANIHPHKRMKLPLGEKFINDFDSLCLSDPDNLNYLKASVRKITETGFDGIIFEESEENFWYCHCSECKRQYVDKTDSTAEAKHLANYHLLSTLYGEIRNVNPNCEVGLRAWREPPLEKDVKYLEYCRDSIPEDVILYWVPGLYVPEKEFEKWVAIFGADRICARDTESNAWAATQGRLLRIFRDNVLRPQEEPNEQFLEKDIEQHIGSVKNRVRGINGYLFEWYGYFLHLFAHANYGWGSQMNVESFCRYSLECVFGEEIAPDILWVLKNIVTIHEGQLKIFEVDFPFLKNKLQPSDMKFLDDCLNKWETIENRIREIIREIESNVFLNRYLTHFEKIEHSHRRNGTIYHLCKAAIFYDQSNDPLKKTEYLKEMEYFNERDFDLIKERYFDVNPVNYTGIKACMYPYHELRRIIHNQLYPDSTDNEPIYMGVEALGWLWIDKKY